MKVSLETLVTDRALEDVHSRVLSALDQFCEFIMMFKSQLEEASELGQEICDSKTNLKLKVEHWNKKVSDIVEKFQDMSAEIIEKLLKIRNYEVNTDELISYLESITKESVLTFEAWKYILES